MKHESSIHCDVLVALAKAVLTNFILTLPPIRRLKDRIELCVLLYTFETNSIHISRGGVTSLATFALSRNFT